MHSNVTVMCTFVHEYHFTFWISLVAFRLASLVELNVSDNNLKMLPPTIGYLKQLTTFLADNNILDFLPPEVSYVYSQVGCSSGVSSHDVNISYVSLFLCSHIPLLSSPSPPLFTVPTPPIFFHFQCKHRWAAVAVSPSCLSMTITLLPCLASSVTSRSSPYSTSRETGKKMH